MVALQIMRERQMKHASYLEPGDLKEQHTVQATTYLPKNDRKHMERVAKQQKKSLSALCWDAVKEFVRKFN
jgi:hypothetical protein